MMNMRLIIDRVPDCPLVPVNFAGPPREKILNPLAAGTGRRRLPQGLI
jgi:hypothetical protein